MKAMRLIGKMRVVMIMVEGEDDDAAVDDDDHDTQ